MILRPCECRVKSPDLLLTTATSNSGSTTPQINQRSRRTTKLPLVEKMHLQTIHFDDIFHKTNNLKYDIDRDKVRDDLNELIKQHSVKSSKLIPRTRIANHTKLQLSYDYLSLADTSPQKLKDKLCQHFHVKETTPTAIESTVANSFLVVSDDGDLRRRDRDRVLEFVMHHSSVLGVPMITWLADRIGEFEMEEETLALRLEPLQWHLAHAFVDFMYTYSWNIVALVVSKRIPGFKNIAKELRKVQAERYHQDHPKYFEFQINSEIYFDGFQRNEIFSEVNLNWHLTAKKYKTVLRELLKSGDRVILFHGNINELSALLKVAYEAKGADAKLRVLFSRDYVWICSASLQTPIQASADRLSLVSPDNRKIADLLGSGFLKVPGMFAFVVMNDMAAFREKSQLARKLWAQSLLTMYDSLQEEGFNDTQILERMRPYQLCQKMDPRWKRGDMLTRIMKSTTIKENGEYIGFLPNGVINTTTLYIFNSKVEQNTMPWVKVGTWSMSSLHGKKKSRLIIDGVTWPGSSNQPPKGRPDKFKLRIATLKERPFVIYKLPEGGVCESNAIPCRVNRNSVESTTVKGGEGVTESSEKSIFHKHQTITARDKRRVDVTTAPNFMSFLESTYGETSNASFIPTAQPKTDPTNDGTIMTCCAGLTMDLLMELKKDLNFEAELFEVPDQKWGGWTPNGWNGLVRLLLDKEADMVITTLKITPNRSSVVDFSVPFQETGISILVALREGAISPTAFLEPYDYPSWLLILVFSVHGTSGAVFIYEWLSPHGLDRGSSNTKNHRFSFARSLWLIWSMLFGASVNADNPRGVASRFLSSIWALFALVFLASYTANLAAFMIAKDEYYKLEGITDWRLLHPLQHQPNFRFATVPSGATEENIKNNYPSMAAYMSHFNKSTVDDGVKALKGGELDAFLYDANVLEFNAAHDDGCKLRTVGNLYAMTGYGVAFPKNSRWLHKVNKMILDYQKNGKLQRWKKYWLTGACKKDDKLGNTNKTLGVKNFISAFILLIGGMILCFLLLVLEHVFYRYLRTKVRQWDSYGCCGLISISMGKLLSFEESVHKTVDLLKYHKCDNPMCESQLLRARHDVVSLHKRIRHLEASLFRKQALLDRCHKEHKFLQQNQLVPFNNISPLSSELTRSPSQPINYSASSSMDTQEDALNLIDYQHSPERRNPLPRMKPNIPHAKNKTSQDVESIKSNQCNCILSTVPLNQLAPLTITAYPNDISISETHPPGDHFHEDSQNIFHLRSASLKEESPSVNNELPFDLHKSPSLQSLHSTDCLNIFSDSFTNGCGTKHVFSTKARKPSQPLQIDCGFRKRNSRFMGSPTSLSQSKLSEYENQDETERRYTVVQGHPNPPPNGPLLARHHLKIPKSDHISPSHSTQRKARTSRGSSIFSNKSFNPIFNKPEHDESVEKESSL